VLVRLDHVARFIKNRITASRRRGRVLAYLGKLVTREADYGKPSAMAIPMNINEEAKNARSHCKRRFRTEFGDVQMR
jgi:hypothetical protein